MIVDQKQTKHTNRCLPITMYIRTRWCTLICVLSGCSLIVSQYTLFHSLYIVT